MIHPLLDALIQPSRPLPAHFRAAGVGMPKALPRLLQFGSVAPPQTGGSQFTGGRVSQPQTSLAHPQAAQGFTPPHYNAGNPTAPSLAPFVQTPQGGPPTGPPFSPGSNPTGPAPPAPPAPPADPHLTHPAVPAGPGGQPPDPYHPPPSPTPALPGGTTPYHPPPSPTPTWPGGTPTWPGGTTPYHPPPSPFLGAVLAALASQGVRSFS